MTLTAILDNSTDKVTSYALRYLKWLLKESWINRIDYYVLWWLFQLLLNHLALISGWVSWVLSWYLYGNFCQFLSGRIYFLYLIVPFSTQWRCFWLHILDGDLRKQLYFAEIGAQLSKLACVEPCDYIRIGDEALGRSINKTDNIPIVSIPTVDQLEVQ